MKPKILIVDDDRNNLDSTAAYLSAFGHDCDVAASGLEAIKLARLSPADYAAVVMDFRMPEMNGAETAKSVLDIQPNAKIIMYSGDDSREALKLSLRSGAVDFVEKDTSPETLLEKISEALRGWMPRMRGHLTPEQKALQSEIGFLGNHSSVTGVIRKIHQYRNLDKSVLIVGETGTGKELVAKGLTPKGSKIWVVNCAAYAGNPQLLEAELFGYVKGAFTGADRNKPGIFTEAHDGVIFLDELHQLDLAAQPKLLRALQEKKIRPIGGSQESSFRARVIATAKPDIFEMEKSGKFLPDLLYRLNVLTINVPALRDRSEDIALLAEYFATSTDANSNSQTVFEREALDLLKSRPWAGNIRELKHFVERIIIESPSLPIGANFVREHLGAGGSIAQTYDQFVRRQEHDERKFLFGLLERYSGNQRKVAAELKISPTTLSSRLKRLGSART